MSNASIPGWAELVARFGHSPSFHDAEVISLELRRAPELSRVRLHVREYTGEQEEDQGQAQDRDVVVTFTLGGITSLRLEGWNHQNVLYDLKVEEREGAWMLRLSTSFGLEGEIGAKDIRVSLDPLEAR